MKTADALPAAAHDLSLPLYPTTRAERQEMALVYVCSDCTPPIKQK